VALCKSTELLARLVENLPPCRLGSVNGSGYSITSVEFDLEEFADDHDLAATAAFTTDAYVSAPQVAEATSSLTEEACLTAWTLIDGLGD
jgi:hypothetical protein